MKKRWVKPQLVVLVRGKPEESVLIACKTEGWESEIVDHAMCDAGNKFGGDVCEACLAVVAT